MDNSLAEAEDRVWSMYSHYKAVMKRAGMADLVTRKPHICISYLMKRIVPVELNKKNAKSHRVGEKHFNFHKKRRTGARLETRWRSAESPAGATGSLPKQLALKKKWSNMDRDQEPDMYASKKGKTRGNCSRGTEHKNLFHREIIQVTIRRDGQC